SLLLSRPFLSRAALRKFVLIEVEFAFYPRRKRVFYFRLGLVQSRFGALRIRAQRQCPLIMLSRQRIHSGVHRRLGGGQRILHSPQPDQVRRDDIGVGGVRVAGKIIFVDFGRFIIMFLLLQTLSQFVIHLFNGRRRRLRGRVRRLRF